MPRRGLVVEDAPDVADMLGRRLRRGGYEIVVAANQEDAYSLLDAEVYDFVLLDLRLPAHAHDLDPNVEVGFDILHRIRDRFSDEVLPVMVMTAYEESSQTAVRSLKAGANDYIRKPFGDDNALEGKVAGMIQARDATRTARSAPSGVPIESLHVLHFRKDACVEIDGIPVDGRAHDLIWLLHRKTLRNGMRGKEIAEELGISEEAVRRQVNRFRDDLESECQRLGRPPFDREEIIRNARRGHGYELNFERFRVTREE